MNKDFSKLVGSEVKVTGKVKSVYFLENKDKSQTVKFDVVVSRKDGAAFNLTGLTFEEFEESSDLNNSFDSILTDEIHRQNLIQSTH